MSDRPRSLGTLFLHIAYQWTVEWNHFSSDGTVHHPCAFDARWLAARSVILIFDWPVITLSSDHIRSDHLFVQRQYLNVIHFHRLISPCCPLGHKDVAHECPVEQVFERIHVTATCWQAFVDRTQLFKPMKP